MTQRESGTRQAGINVTVRDQLRAIPSLVGEPVGFDPNSVPTTPEALFLSWLRAAEHAGIPEPHAMTVSTVDANGLPDARMLVLKDLTESGAWCFAGKRDSSKGRELAACPAAALTFYWREQLRSVRVRGTITEGSKDDSTRDFAARSADARAVALSGRQSTPVTSYAEVTREIGVGRQRLAGAPDLVPEDWTVWRLDPIEVEFWEGSSTRAHTRLRYQRARGSWRTTLLYP